MTAPTAAPKQLTEEEELAILFPEPVDFKAGRLTIPLLPMDTITCARFAAKARPIIKLALTAQTDFVSAILVAALDYPDEAVAALSIATGKSAEFIGRLPPALAGELARKVFDINQDFFGQSAALPGSGAQAKSPDPAADGVGLTH